MRIDFIINPSGPDTVEALRSEVERLRELGHQVHARLTFEAGDACHFAQEAAAAGSSLVISAGGDGTLNETVNGVHAVLAARAGEAAAGGWTPPRVAVLPLGTANDLANALGMPSDVSAAVDAVLAGEASEVDVASVNGRCFLNVSTGGFGAEATEETSHEAKNALGSLAYVITGVKKFVRLDPSPGRFLADELLYEGPFLLFAVGNSVQTGGGNLLTPEADPADGFLDVCIVKEMSRVKFLALLPNLRSGNHIDHDAVIYRRVPRLLVEAGETITVNADGESLHGTHFHYCISPHRLLLVRPREETASPGEGAGGSEEEAAA